MGSQTVESHLVILPFTANYHSRLRIYLDILICEDIVNSVSCTNTHVSWGQLCSQQIFTRFWCLLFSVMHVRYKEVEEELEKAFLLGGRFIADLIGNPMELSIFLRIHLLDLHEGVQDTDDKDGGAAVETPDHGRRNLALRGDVRDPDPSEENREEIANKASGIAQQRLNGICLGLLLLSHHVTDHHLEWLHRHIDRGVQEYQGKQAKPHRPVKSEEQLGGEIEASGIGQESHHQHSNDSPDKEIGLSSTHLAPGPVGILPDQGLDDHSHQRRKDPKETELMGVSSKGSEDTADVSALEGVRYLHAKEPEAQVPHVPE